MIACLVPLVLALAAPAYPAGRSQQKIEGLETTLLVPDDLAGGSLLVVLHGSGDSGANLAGAFQAWVDAGYVVCAPSAPSKNWTAPDVAAARRIAAHLVKSMPIAARKVHVTGYSNGGWNLAPLAFDEKLQPRSATWIGAGYRGGGVGRWARKGLGVLALAGELDPNAKAARDTVRLLDGKVRTVEVRLQEGLGHKLPTQHFAYALWWMGVQEGRFQPGDDRNFAWRDDVDDALESVKGQEKGGLFVYVFSTREEEQELTRRLQSKVLQDPLVRHFGNQLVAVKEEAYERTTELGVKSTPAIVVLTPDGTVRKILAGKIKARSLAAALRSIAPNKKRPGR